MEENKKEINKKEINVDPELNELMEELFLKYYNILLRYAVKLAPNMAIAEDVVMDAFYIALRKQDIKTHENPGGWMMITVKNLLRNVTKRMFMHETADIENYAEGLSLIEEQYGETEVGMLLELYLGEHERMLFNKYYFQGYTAKEMAEMEGITESNLKVKMHRLRKKLILKAGVSIR